jgi:hypothetical protein
MALTDWAGVIWFPAMLQSSPTHENVVDALAVMNVLSMMCVGTEPLCFEENE